MDEAAEAAAKRIMVTQLAYYPMKIHQYWKSLICISIAAAWSSLAPGSLAADKPGKKEDAKPYPLKTCVVSGEKLGEMGKPYVLAKDGQEYQLCCKGCLDEFNKETSKFAKKVADAQKNAKPYPLDTCVVTDEKLGEMGKPYSFVYDGQEYKLCCASCLKEFKKNPAKHEKKVAQAAK